MNLDLDILGAIVGNVFAGVHGIELADEERLAIAGEMLDGYAAEGSMPALTDLDAFNTAIEDRGMFYDPILGFVLFSPAE